MNMKKEIKFSIITLIKDSRPFLERYYKSIIDQNYSNYEIIIVDNGSKDDSVNFIKNLKNNKIKIFNNASTSVGVLRNYAISKATGEYFITVDSDDYLNNNLLNVLNEELKNTKYDFIKYNAITQNTETKLFQCNVFGIFTGKELLKNLCIDFVRNGSIFGPSWLYAINLQFFKENELKYGHYLQEDFGLTPFLCIKATIAKSIEFDGYNYFIRNNSITTNPRNTFKKAQAVIKYYDIFQKRLLSTENDTEFISIFSQYLNSTLKQKLLKLTGKELIKYQKELKRRNIIE